jgi:hypothetical protein
MAEYALIRPQAISARNEMRGSSNLRFRCGIGLGRAALQILKANRAWALGPNSCYSTFKLVQVALYAYIISLRLDSILRIDRVALSWIIWTHARGPNI